MRQLLKLLTLSGISLVFAALIVKPAFAHVIVTPANVQTAAWQTFNVSVPNEKDDATTSIKLLLPKGLEHVSPTVKPGWTATVTTDAITWSDGSIAVGMRDDFTFSAQVPATATDLDWKAYQTYADGTVVSWDKANTSKEEGTNSGPFSVTHVVTKLPTDPAVTSAANSASDAQDTAHTALYLAIASVVVGFVALYASTRRK